MFKFLKRKPDLNIGPDYLHRWYIIPRNRLLNIYLHKIIEDDQDKALHDHPWWSLSFKLSSTTLVETLPGRRRTIKRFLPVVRSPYLPHRLSLENRRGCIGVKKPVFTLFITGPRIRRWGFHTWAGWRDWAACIKNVDGKSVWIFSDRPDSFNKTKDVTFDELAGEEETHS